MKQVAWQTWNRTLSLYTISSSSSSYYSCPFPLKFSSRSSKRQAKISSLLLLESSTHTHRGESSAVFRYITCPNYLIPGHGLVEIPPSLYSCNNSPCNNIRKGCTESLCTESKYALTASSYQERTVILNALILIVKCFIR